MKMNFPKNSMMRSADRILTTHTGSLPRPDALRELFVRRQAGESVDGEALEKMEQAAVRESIDRQVIAGIDVGNDGEQTRENFFLYMTRRLSGFGGDGWDRPLWADVERYPRYRKQREAEQKGKVAVTARDRIPEAISEVHHISVEAVVRECNRLKATLNSVDVPFAETFVTAPSPGIIARAMRNRFYESERDYITAIGKALQIEYEQIVSHGFVLQIDAPDLAVERHMEFKDRPIGDFLNFAETVVEVINDALVNIPPDRVRMHVCWGNYEGPHDCDVELAVILPILLQARVGAFVLPFANPRHAHDFTVFRRQPLGDNQCLVAGVIDTLTNVIEHPQVVADRLERIAAVLDGPTRLIAGTDCGFDTAAGSGRVADDVVWAKLASLAEGARLASQRLF
jgi:5-methyltetrahydropteroyltriglutamate--homocysteine methyltransferase